MKDITRIHIAKVPYSIELSAKKELEEYIGALEAYTADSELMQDIEIRITELLLERGVKQEDVIASADVVAIREQLGEPKEFMTDEATGAVDPGLLESNAPRKLYRNIDNAIIGGVLSGAASYLRVNALWVRLAFIVLIFVSFGFFVLLYLVAWLIIPPARTAAEKLQMTGRPVTLASIRELNEVGSSNDSERRGAIMKRILTAALAVGAIITAFATVATLVAAGVALTSEGETARLSAYQIPMALTAVSGVLLLALSLLVAVAAFAQKFNKRIWISAIVITVLGLASFGTAITLGSLQHRSEIEAIQRNTVEVVEKLPSSFASVTALIVDIPDATNVNYIVDASAPSVKQRMLRGSPKVKVVVENGVAKVSLEASRNRPYGAEAAITIYGPSVASVTVTNGSVLYDAGTQAMLKIEARNASNVSIAESRIDTLDVTIDGTAQFTADQASVSMVRMLLASHPYVSLGNIKTLTVKGPEACAANAAATLEVQNILSATYEYNGTQTASRTMEDPCYKIRVGSDDMRTYQYQD